MSPPVDEVEVLLDDELEPPVPEIVSVSVSVSPPLLLDVESTASAAQKPSTRLQSSPAQQLSSSRHARARSPTATHSATHAASSIVPDPGS